MRNLPLALAGLLLLIPAAAGAGTLSDPKIGFNADRTLVIDGHEYEGKMWAMPGEERHEQAIQAFHPIFLLRSGNPLGEVVVPQLKTIVEFVMPPELRLFGSPAIRRHPVGQDTLQGIATTKYAIDESMPEGRAKGLLWLSRDNIPMKLAGSFTAPKGKVIKVLWELTHVHLGPQPADLFEVPHGYTKLPADAVLPLLGMHLKRAKE